MQPIFVAINVVMIRFNNMYILEKTRPSFVGLLGSQTFDTVSELNEKLETIKEHYRNAFGDGVISECPEDRYIMITLHHWPEPLVFSWYKM